MVNHDLMFGQNHSVSLSQNQISHNHNVAIAQNHGLEVGQTHDHEAGLGQNHDSEGNDDHEYEHESGVMLEQKPEDDVHDAPLPTESNELDMSEHNELVVSGNQDLDENMELAVIQQDLGIESMHDMSVQQGPLVVTPNHVLQARTLAVNPNYELHVGQEFPDVKACRRALRDTAIALHFEMQTIKSDKTRFTAKCANEGCPWRIHAAKLPGMPTFTIRTINDNHTCGGIAHLGHQQASVQWVANSVEQRLLENPNCKPKEILEEIHRVHEASGLPIIQMMECIRRQLMTWFNERRETSIQWTSILVPTAERRVTEALERARTYQVLRANEAEFEVISHEGTNIVDIRNRCCLCRGWQLYGLPCAHAVAALLSCRQNVHRFTESCFTVATYRKTYSQTIHPIPDKTLWKELAEGDPNASKAANIVVNPPKSLRPPGRPRKKRHQLVRFAPPSSIKLWLKTLAVNWTVAKSTNNYSDLYRLIRSNTAKINKLRCMENSFYY
ncbi:unnamed protein product [Fraxinus pennsylvanica]|uniref:SWIM-type domain-containing protein n=1 Tax=Fraxinus pennsylvanica TaxID=56036 RepID=A0AAD2E0P3_9LAMI|nr:unnamed protein product [Fraxinus pennsylvanica]